MYASRTSYTNTIYNYGFIIFLLLYIKFVVNVL